MGLSLIMQVVSKIVTRVGDEARFGLRVQQVGGVVVVVGHVRALVVPGKRGRRRGAPQRPRHARQQTAPGPRLLLRGQRLTAVAAAGTSGPYSSVK